jgi:hypothetical protein
MKKIILFIFSILALSLSAEEYYVFKTLEVYKGAYVPRMKEHSIESDSVVCKASFSPCVLGGSAGLAFILKGKGFDNIPIFFAQNVHIVRTDTLDTYFGMMYDGVRFTNEATLEAHKSGEEYTDFYLRGDGFSVSLLNAYEVSSYKILKKNLKEIKQYKSDSISGLTEVGNASQLFVDTGALFQYMKESKDNEYTIYCKIDTTGRVNLDEGNNIESARLFELISFTKIVPLRREYKAINKSLPVVTKHTIKINKANLGSCLKEKGKYINVKTKFDKKANKWIVSVPELNEKNLDLNRISIVFSLPIENIAPELTSFVQNYLESHNDYKANTLRVDIKIREVKVSGVSCEINGFDRKNYSLYYMEYIIVDKS